MLEKSTDCTTGFALPFAFHFYFVRLLHGHMVGPVRYAIAHRTTPVVSRGNSAAVCVAQHKRRGEAPVFKIPLKSNHESRVRQR